jgi:dTDP-glucose pyrophosphorylase
MKQTPSPTLLVLAAGMGSRYGGLKQIEPIGPHGETILDYSICDALRAGFAKAVFVLRREIEPIFRKNIAGRFENRIAIEYVFQDLNDLPQGFTPPPGRTKPWGTAHAVLTAASAIHEPFAVVNADDFYGPESYHLLAKHLQSNVTDYAMAGFLLRNTLSTFGSVARGICQVNSKGYLQSVEEFTRIEPEGEQAINTSPDGHITHLTGDETVSMNMWGFTPLVFLQLRQEFLNFLKRHTGDLKSECYLPTAVNALIQSGQAQVKVLRTPSSWFGVTYREDHPRVVESIRQLIRDGHYPERLWL